MAHGAAWGDAPIGAAAHFVSSLGRELVRSGRWKTDAREIASTHMSGAVALLQVAASRERSWWMDLLMTIRAACRSGNEPPPDLNFRLRQM